MAPHEKFCYKNAEDLLAKIVSLNLDIPFSPDLEILFEPLTIAGRRLQNRMAVHPMEAADADSQGAPTEWTRRRYRRFAEGGSGLIVFEATAVVPEGRSNPRQLLLTKGTLDGFKALLEETRIAGVRAGQSPVCILQVTHSGRFARTSTRRTPLIASCIPTLDAKLGIAADHALLTDASLDRLLEKFVSAGRLAAAAGFDGLDVKACHGYLVAELLSSFGRGQSRYGGSFDNRSRFLLDLVDRVRREIPGLLIAPRLGVYDGIPRPYGFGVDQTDEKKEDLSEPRELVRRLQNLGVSLLSVSAGVPFLNPALGRPYDRGVRGAGRPDEHPLEGIARLIRLTGEMQRTFPGLPMLGAGYSWLRTFGPHVAAGVLKRGGATLFGLGRGALAYPDWVKDLASRGRLNPGKVCTTCSRCSEMLRDGLRVGCPVRDTAYAAMLRKGPRTVRKDGQP